MYSHALPSFIVDDPYNQTNVAGLGGAAEGRAASPLNGDRNPDSPQTHEQLIAQNSSLKTRVSELELIHELFRGRLGQLEQQEAAARRGHEVAGVEQDQLRSQLEITQHSEAQLLARLDDSHRRENSLKRRLDDLELELKAAQEALADVSERPTKRPRIAESSTKAEQALDVPKTNLTTPEGELAEPSEMIQTTQTSEVREATEALVAPEASIVTEPASIPEVSEAAPVSPSPWVSEIPSTEETPQTGEMAEVVDAGKLAEDVEIPDAPAVPDDNPAAPPGGIDQSAKVASSEESPAPVPESVPAPAPSVTA